MGEHMKHELNSQNTKQMLCDALIELSAKKPFSKITVSEIVNLCNVNRKTFYYHFEDIYDLLEWHLNNEIQRAISIFEPPYDLNALITFSVDYMNQHPYLHKFVQDPIAREKITKLLNQVLSPKVSELFLEREAILGKSIEKNFREFLVKYLTHITVLSILDAIENPNNYDIETMKRYIAIIFDMSMHGIFQQP